MTPADLILNGRCTGLDLVISSISTHAPSNHWTSQEYNAANAWNVNFGSGNVNNNNKYNGYAARAVVALSDQVKEEWIAAYEDCCRHKMTSLQCTLYRLAVEDDLFALAYEVYHFTYTISTSVTFVVKHPKYREIFAANFRDRIVQHWIIERINPFFERRFHELGDISYNCRIGFGTLAAVQRAQTEIARISQGYTVPAYLGLIDISSFFMTIDREVCWQLLEPFIREHADEILEMYPGTDVEVLIWVTHLTVMNSPQEDCVRKGELGLWEYLPPMKSFFPLPFGMGLPIGNITSQLIANFLLSFLDEFLLKICRERGAIILRFVDDILIIARTTEDVVFIRKAADWFLREKLHQKLHPNKFYLQETHKGVKFIGSVIKPGRTYTSNRTIGGFRKAVVAMEATCRELVQRGVSIKRLAALEHYVAAINSYFGFTVHTASFNVRRKLISRLNYFWKVCYIVNLSTVRIRKKYLISTVLIQQEHEDYITKPSGSGPDIAEPLPPARPHRQLRRRVQLLHEDVPVRERRPRARLLEQGRRH